MNQRMRTQIEHMTPGYLAANFAIKGGYFFVEALLLIFVGMLVLTAVHP